MSQGTVVFRGERIVAVEPEGGRAADFDLGNAALLPGFVNAHTHLDLTGLRGLNPPGADFPGWLDGVVRHRQARSEDDTLADIHAGLAECVRCGTTLIGDISHRGLSWDALAGGPVRGVVFYEIIGLSADRAGQAGAEAEDWLRAHGATATCRPGLSPHAPYSVRRSLYEAAARLVRDHPPAVIATHLAESATEVELLRHRRGPFVRFLEERGAWHPDGLVADPEDVGRLLAGVPACLVHGNFLAALGPAARGGTVVYCPRTHAAFGHPPHPFRDLLAHGRRVALGTDSLASNPDLDLLAEARFLHKIYPSVNPGSLVRLATLSGAEALAWHGETGSLSPGKSADLVVLPLPDADLADPHELVLASSLPVAAVLCRGRWVYGADGSGPG